MPDPIILDHEWFVLFSELKLCLKLGECSW